jgi:glyceraldehyde 3-phosphate dehydrogenase
MTDGKTRVGLMGFGRIGRNVFRQLEGHPDIEVAAIVDIADPKALVYLLKYDSVFGRFPGKVTLDDSSNLIVDGRVIPMLPAKDPGDVDWAAHGITVVVQATRKHRTAAECRRHLEKGAKRVVLASTPADPAEMDTLITGVNDEVLGPEDTIVALGSNTSNAVAPVLKVLLDRFGVEGALFTTVHALTNDARLADVPSDTLRGSRSGAENIIPGPTNSPEIVERALPLLQGKLAGLALNVPVQDGSNVDLVAFLSRPTTAAEIDDALRAAAEGSSVLGYTDEPIVSSDIIGSTYSGTVDGLSTLVMMDTMAKLVIWYDNGWGYAARAVELIEKFAEFDHEGKQR